VSRVLAVPASPRFAEVGGVMIGTGISITNRRPLGNSPTPTPTVVLSNAIAQNEGNSGTTAFTYTVSRSSSVGAVNVPWTFSAGSTLADDFAGGAYPAGGSVAMADGVSTGTITINVAGDATVEGDDSFTVSISAPSGYALGSPSSATGTILNDDSASVTQTYSYAAAKPGWTLLYDDVITAGKNFVLDAVNQDRASCWVGVITGTSARVRMGADFSVNVGDLLRVSVDGGAYVATGGPDANGEYLLFEGLPDAPHFVIFMVKLKPDGGANTYGFMPTTGADVLRVTGAAPALTVPEWSVIGGPDTKGIKPTGLIPSLTAGGRAGASRSMLFRPAYNGSGITPNVGRVGELGHIAVRGALHELWVVTQHRFFWVWDGATLTRHDTNKIGANGSQAVRAHRVTGLGGALKTYHVWSGNTVAVQGGWFAVGSPQSITAPSGMYQAHLFGDSITQGSAGDDGGSVDLLRSFAKQGYACANGGIAGQTTAQLNAGIDGYLIRLAITANDVAHVATGQNDNPTVQADVEGILNKLLAYPYRKIIVRGVLPVSGNGHLAKNTTIQAAIAAVNNPRVAYINPNAWTGIDKPDGIHPSVAGYDTLVGFMDAVLPGALA